MYVDLARSDRDAARALLVLAPPPAATREPAASPGPARPRNDPPGIDSPLFGGSAIVSRAEYQPRVTRAARARTRLAAAVGDAFRSLLGRGSIGMDPTRQAVSSMVGVMREDPTASLWLTRLDTGDDYASRHAVNACVLALSLGRHLGMDRRQLEELGIGTLLMDVGRLVAPGDVFPKPGRLSPQDWKHVRRHVADGLSLLNRSRVSTDALEIVRNHHERVLGQGYPSGLDARRIPRTALIAGIADTYDAMLHRRPYRPAFQPEQAIGVLHQEAHSTFGTELVGSFVQSLGPYPVGSVVELQDGAIGVVVGNRPGAGLQPTLLLVRGADRQPLKRRVLLNLAARHGDPSGHGTGDRPIRRALDPAELSIRVDRVLAEEFGLFKGL